MRLIDADRLLSDAMKTKYYHLPNRDVAIPIIDIEHAPTVDEGTNVPYKWISVKDRMPEKGVQVWGAIYGHDVIVAKDGETVWEAMNRTMREFKRVDICVWGGKEEGWLGRDGFHLVVQPRLWMPIEWPKAPDLEELE